jgi:hypothetical protein
MSQIPNTASKYKTVLTVIVAGLRAAGVQFGPAEQRVLQRGGVCQVPD